MTDTAFGVRFIQYFVQMSNIDYIETIAFRLTYHSFIFFLGLNTFRRLIISVALHPIMKFVISLIVDEGKNVQKTSCCTGKICSIVTLETNKGF